MYQGKNPTALQSQNLITEALLALMEEEPFQKITIKAVCAHAGVSRQTFYSLFENKEEVIGRRLDRLFEEYRKRFIAEKRAYTIRSLCDSIMECFVEQEKTPQSSGRKSSGYIGSRKIGSVSPAFGQYFPRL